MAQHKLERSQLVAPDAKTLRAIRKAMKDHDDAQVRLEAALITLEIVAEKTGALVVVSGEEPGERSTASGCARASKGIPRGRRRFARHRPPPRPWTGRLDR